MELYHEWYRICMAGAVAGVFLSGVLFVRLDVRTAVRVLTGDRMQKEVLAEKKKQIKKKKKKTAVKVPGEEQTTLIKRDNRLFRVLEEILVVHTEERIEAVYGYVQDPVQEERMRRKRWIGTKLVIFLLCFCGGLHDVLPARAEEEWEPKVSLVSAVNDYGTTVTDEEGTYYFRESLTVTLYFTEPEKTEGETAEKETEEKTCKNAGEEKADRQEEEKPDGQQGEKEDEEQKKEEDREEAEEEDDREETENQEIYWILRRDGVELVGEEGLYQDLLLEGGIYQYTLEAVGKEGLEEVQVLTVCAQKYGEEPMVSLRFDQEPVSSEGMHYFSELSKMTLEAEAACGIAEVAYRTPDGAYLPLEAPFQEEPYLFGEQSSLAIPFLEQESLEEGRHSYMFRVTDCLGGSKEETAEFLLDKTPPDGEVFVSYDSDGTNASVAKETGIRRLISSIREWLFAKTRIDFSLYIKDGTPSGQQGAEASGLDWADLRSQIEAKEQSMKVRDLQLAEEGTARFSFEGTRREGYTKVTGCLTLPRGIGTDLTDALVVRRLKDRAGNITTGEEGEGFTGTTVLCLDRTAPVLLTDLGPGVVDEERKWIFYRGDAVIGLSLTEANYTETLDEEGQVLSPKVTVTGPEGQEAGLESWQPSGTGVFSSIRFPALSEGGEAVYTFEVEYQDGAGNLLEKEGAFTDYTIIVDNQAPELIDFQTEGKSSCRKDGMAVYQNRDGADVVFSFVLKDAKSYWNPARVRLEVYDQSTEELAAAVDGTGLDWQEEGDLHRASYAFDGAEGFSAAAYYAVLTYEDCAGNPLTGSQEWTDAVSGGRYTGNAFWLDHEAPVLSLSYPAANRLVREGDPDPESDERDAVPKPGYTAYYGKEVQVFFFLREAWACPIREEETLVGLRDFSLVVFGKRQGELEPKVAWKQTKEGYEGRFTLEKEDGYTFALSYQDPAGNLLEAEGEAAVSGLAEGRYTSPALVVDRTVPILRASYTDQSGAPVDRSALPEREGRTYFSEPVLLRLELQDEHLRSQEVKDVLSGLQVFDCASRVLGENSVARYVEGLDGSQLIPGACTWYVPLSTEGIYQIPVGAEDLAGNRTEWVWEEAAVDRTEPELSLSCQTEPSGFLDFIRYGDLTYLFADCKVTVTAAASDSVSGIQSIRFLTEEADAGEINEYKKEFSPAEKGEFQMVFPASGEDFMGKVTVQAFDWSRNRTVKSGGQIVESRKKHERSKNLTITTLTAPGRTVGDQHYYNTDIRFQVQAEDAGSGLGKLSVTGGTTIDRMTDYTKGAGEIVWKYKEEFLLEAAQNNENAVPVRAEYQDNAGHIHTAEQSYNIDLVPPRIQVTYDQNDPMEGNYYCQIRTALVEIRERNFDPADVEFQITNTDGGMPGFGGWTASGTGDDTLHVCPVTFAEDGDYTFSLAVTDLAGNRTEYGQTDAFTIDQTAPVLTVSFDQEQSRNGLYYGTGRMARIEILEHNFDPSFVEVSVTAEDGAEAPALSGWRTARDESWAELSFLDDGIYQFRIAGTDLAGNPMEPYETERFVIDRTPPKIEITGVEHRSANPGPVTPRIQCSDRNYDLGQTSIRLEGVQNGTISFQGTREERTYGMDCQIEDFAYTQEMDDLYRLQVTACDLAGNQSEEEMVFSVNRFGSVYTLDERTNLLAGNRGIYYTSEEQELVVTETNVDTLVCKEITCNRDGALRTLTEGEDYTVRESGTDESWKQYEYTIFKNNFEEEGIYVLTIYSEDQARNASDNDTKGMRLEFAVDKTPPSILLSGVEDGGQYREEGREMTLDVEDNLCLTKMQARINGIPSTYYASEVLEAGGRIRLMTGSRNQWQTIQVTAWDAAGNQAFTDTRRFLITPNLLIQFYMDRPLFYGTSGILLLSGTAGTAIWMLRKRKYQNRR